MKLNVVIVNYNVRHYLEQCLLSLQKALENIEAEVYVVDNHSKDGSVEQLQPRFPSVKFITSQHNLGFARANNVAIRQGESEYVLLLNPDTIVTSDAIMHSVEFMDAHPEAGALGLKMLRADGSPAKESRRGLPTPLTAFYKMTGLCERFPNHRKLGKYYMGYLPWDAPCEIEVVSGAFCMLRREALNQVGLLDEDYFMYGEDIDLSYRILKAGWKNWYIPEHILHYKGESTQKSSFRYVHVFYGSMLIFFRKHYNHLSWLISLPVKLAIFMKAFLASVHMIGGKLRKSLGFFTRQNTDVPFYLFIGTEQSISQCREIAAKNALNADFVVGTEQSLPDGHLALADRLKSGTTNYVVYDMSAYSFDTTLSILERKPDNKILIGTYYPQSAKIITDREVIK
ncbi:MAG: glycosyltransferase family 2 protein [Prevotella sp.]|nr:glycosyltransferase family 2 protein [Prevotella sp.]